MGPGVRLAEGVQPREDEMRAAFGGQVAHEVDPPP